MGRDGIQVIIDLADCTHLRGLESLVSSGREPPPPALSEPYVTISRHTAPAGRPCNWAWVYPLAPPLAGWPRRDPGLPDPLAPAPLQSLRRYYGSVRPCAPHRYLCPSRCLTLGVLPLAARGPTWPISPGRHYRGDRFSCLMPAPATSSRHLYTGHHQGHTQAAPWLRARLQGEPLS
jgi:hypothetical protein